MDLGDHALLDTAMAYIDPNNVLVADRAFGSYEMMARIGNRAQRALVARQQSLLGRGPRATERAKLPVAGNH